MAARRAVSKESGKITKRSASARTQDDPALITLSKLPSRSDAATIDEGARNDIRLSFLMHDVSRMRRSAYDQFMKPLGITRAQWWVLAHLSRHDGMMQTQLADVLEVGKASLGDVVEGLESAGWVKRSPDPTDKRAKRVYLTRAAQGLIRRMTVAEMAFNDKIFAELPREEREALFRALMKIKTAIARLQHEAADGNASGERA